MAKLIHQALQLPSIPPCNHPSQLGALLLHHHARHRASHTRGTDNEDINPSIGQRHRRCWPKVPTLIVTILKVVLSGVDLIKDLVPVRPPNLVHRGLQELVLGIVQESLQGVQEELLGSCELAKFVSCLWVIWIAIRVAPYRGLSESRLDHRIRGIRWDPQYCIGVKLGFLCFRHFRSLLNEFLLLETDAHPTRIRPRASELLVLKALSFKLQLLNQCTA
mmetsp:Transcript_80330/g.236325  ORF Transcript_80330/g.236325 Transcript_80330/m.236325 type:complete len:220 (+) Transcript_80330:1221-1880(+)